MYSGDLEWKFAVPVVCLITVGNFHTLPEIVNMLELFGREFFRREVGNKVLINPFRYLKTNHPQPQMVFGTAVRDKVKGNVFAYAAV